LNLQGVSYEGIENDPVDQRAWAGVASGWPMRMKQQGAGVVLELDAMPETQFRYTIEFQPAEPDGIAFSIRFTFLKKPAAGQFAFRRPGLAISMHTMMFVFIIPRAPVLTVGNGFLWMNGRTSLSANLWVTSISRISIEQRTRRYPRVLAELVTGHWL